MGQCDQNRLDCVHGKEGKRCKLALYCSSIDSLVARGSIILHKKWDKQTFLKKAHRESDHDLEESKPIFSNAAAALGTVSLCDGWLQMVQWIGGQSSSEHTLCMPTQQKK